MTTDEHFEKHDREIAELRARLQKVEEKLGITYISPEGVPTDDKNNQMPYKYNGHPMAG